MNDNLQGILMGAVRAVAIFGGIMTLAPILVLAERRICAAIQNRIGPNRVGPMGLLQPLADVIKLLFKEDIIPDRADRTLFSLAPLLAFAPAAIAFVAIPVGRDLQVADLNVGVLYVLAITSLGVYGISFGGWASNSKYSLLGGIRSSAQIISYEIAMGLAIVSVLMVSGNINLGNIVQWQADNGWIIFYQPVAFLIFLVAAFAENNRLPFDMAECEAELVGGFHTEYSGMKFCMFFLGEYLAMIVMSSLMVTLFLGGWDPLFFELPEGAGGTVLSVLCFVLKLLAVLFFYIWVRWTLPRFRYDQLMKLGWKTLIPLALLNIVVTGVVVALLVGTG
ncbi:MAG TPA: NADH-quinone oxidoreductase subunit NuoH [Planctomycetes bacterium]|nr:NADH-quinone oxidoreductase subunit NuoH [Planctomycetota bacterium]